MMELWQVLFWVAIGIIFWSYIGYFGFLYLISLFYTRKVQREDWTPPITVVITAYNEEKRIRQKLDNTLALDYPKDVLNILVVSDGSTDATLDIVRSYAPHGVQLLHFDVRRGKHYGQGRGIQQSSTDIVVLTDATTFLEPDAVRKIVRPFADPKIGVVSGEDRTDDSEGHSQGEGAYVKYEMALRSLENQVGSLVGASGCFFSVRKSLCDAWIDDMSSDFYMPIVAHMKGYRAVMEQEAIGKYRVLDDPAKEFHRKVRTVVHGLEVLFHFKPIMNPFKHGLYAIQMLSHKLLRWLVPFALMVALVANAVLLYTHLFYQMTFALQVILYVLALAAYLAQELQGQTMFKIPLFFVMVNVSILVAWAEYLRGEKYVLWEATKR